MQNQDMPEAFWVFATSDWGKCTEHWTKKDPFIFSQTTSHAFFKEISKITLSDNSVLTDLFVIVIIIRIYFNNNKIFETIFYTYI